jgi:hypothetical protein
LSGKQNQQFRDYLDKSDELGLAGVIKAYKKYAAPWRIKKILSLDGTFSI